MTHPKSILQVCGLLGVALLTNSCGERAPDNIQVVAEYRPGSAEGRAWVVVISGSGAVTQEVLEFRGNVINHAELSGSELKDLVTTVDGVDFLDLEVRSAGILDAPVLTLYVTRGGLFHTVQFTEGEDVTGDPDVRRFYAVWNKVLELVPPPERGWTPGADGP
jgi:hypothetical protein